MSEDCLEFFAHRLLLRACLDSNGFGSSTARFVPAYGLVDCQASDRLAQSLRALRAAVEWYRQPILDADPDATPGAFVMTLLAELRIRGVEPDERTVIRWHALCQEPAMREPFPRQAMVVPLEHVFAPTAPAARPQKAARREKKPINTESPARARRDYREFRSD